MSGILVVTWDGGGNVPPALCLSAELVRRGDRVTVLGHPQQAEAILRTGASARSFTHVADWDPRVRRDGARFAVDYLRLFTDARFGRETAEAIAAIRPDVVVVDALLPAAIAAAVAEGLPTVVLVHTVLSAIVAMSRGPIGAVCRLKGFSYPAALGAADALLVASPAALATPPLLPRAVHVGPLFGESEAMPAAADPRSRRILVSLSTIHYSGMERVLQRILDAVEMAGAPAVVTTGDTIDPSALRVPSGVEVHRRVPHSEVLPEIGLVIGHGGHGTATKALTAGVPVLVRPLTPLGDHVAVAAGLEYAGVGGRLAARGTAAALAQTITAALDDEAMRSRAVALGATLRASDGTSAAADTVQRLAAVEVSERRLRGPVPRPGS